MNLIQSKYLKQFSKYVSLDIFAMLGLSCYTFVDTFFIEQVAHSDGMTVLNLALPIYNLIFAFGSMIGLGAATRFAILKEVNDSRYKFYFQNALLFGTVIGLIFTVIGAIFPNAVIQIMGGDKTIVALGTGYFRYVLLFAPTFIVNYIVSAFVRNDGAPGLAMWATIFSCMFNIVFDYFLMFPLGMGIEGAALATVLSPLVAIGINLLHFISKNNTVKFHSGKNVISITYLFRACPLGISGFIGEISLFVTTTVFNFLLLNLAGNIGIAAYGVIANYALIVTAIFNGIAQGTQPLISEYYGKNNKQAVKSFCIMGLTASIITAIILYILVVQNTDVLVMLFNSGGNAQLSQYAHTGMRLYFIGYIFAGINIFLSAYYGASNNQKNAFIISILRGLVLIIICPITMSYLMGINGIWLSFALAEALTVLISIPIYRR